MTVAATSECPATTLEDDTALPTLNKQSVAGLTALAYLAVCALLLSPAQAESGLPEGFVYLRDVEPSIAQDIRYAEANNFAGHPAPGYKAPECVLAGEAARALKRVQKALKPQGLSLKVYDCYRPARAVRSFVTWARSPANEGSDKKSYYPNLTKPELLKQEYIASPSGHSLGTAVDLTLIRTPVSGSDEGKSSSAGSGTCTAPQKKRAPDNSVDMGTGFDCFDELSHTANPQITPKQRHWRQTLLQAMKAAGFANYPLEWWHFSMSIEGYDKHLDFPVEPRLDGDDRAPGDSGDGN